MRIYIGPYAGAPEPDIAQSGSESQSAYGEPGSGHRVSVGIQAEDIVESHTTPGVYYTLRLGGDGVWRCNCPDTTCRLNPRCKHVVQKLEEQSAGGSHRSRDGVPGPARVGR